MKKRFVSSVRTGVVRTVFKAAPKSSQTAKIAILPKPAGKTLKTIVHSSAIAGGKAVSQTVDRKPVKKGGK